MRHIVFDMETGDPDDILTLIILLGHPEVDVKAVTITPGTVQQVGLVRHVLGMFNRNDIPVGAYNIGHDRVCVSGWHYKTFGNFLPSDLAEPGWRVLYNTLGPGVTLVTGAPLKNLGALLTRLTDMDHPEYFVADPIFRFKWVAQGGFAGTGVVPDDWQLEKFKGKDAVPTYNLNGDPKSALLALSHVGKRYISEAKFVSKNVCHGVFFDADLLGEYQKVLCENHRLCDCPCHRPNSYTLHFMACCVPCQYCGAPVSDYQERGMTPQTLSFHLVHKAMAAYLRRKPEGKKFHDPLAAMCAIDPDIGIWEKVELYRRGGQWGSYCNPDSKVEIIVKHDHDLFVGTLLGGHRD